MPIVSCCGCSSGGGGGGGTTGPETITNLSYNPATRTISYVNEAGTVQTATIAETATTLSYNPTTRILTYAGETGLPQTIDLSALAADIFVNGASFDATSRVLTLTDNSGATPDVTVNLAALASTVTDNLNGTYTHVSGGISTVIDRTLSVSTIPTTGNYNNRIIELNGKLYKYLAVPGTYIEIS